MVTFLLISHASECFMFSFNGKEFTVNGKDTGKTISVVLLLFMCGLAKSNVAQVSIATRPAAGNWGSKGKGGKGKGRPY